MLRIVRTASVVLGSAVGVVLCGAAVNPAAADCAGVGVGCAPETNGNSVSVTVTGSFVNAGSPGSSGGTTTVYVPTPCVWYQGWTGKEYYDGVQDGSINGAGSDEADRGEWKPFAGWKDHKNDTEGHWYYPGCSNVNNVEWEEFDRYVENYFDTHDGAFVQPGGTPPIPPIPPEVLLQAAQEVMEAPQPEFEYNPDAAGAFDTLVNMDTWFWLADPTQAGSVTATAGQNSVTVNATLDDVTFSALNAGGVDCAGTGTEWSQGSASDCVLTFDSAGPAEVTADTNWAVTWTFNGQPQGAVDPLVATFTQTLGVAESQSLVRDVG